MNDLATLRARMEKEAPVKEIESFDPVEFLTRACNSNGLRIRAHHTVLVPLWKKLMYRRGRDKKFKALIIRLNSDYLDIQNGEHLLAPLEEIFQ